MEKNMPWFKNNKPKWVEMKRDPFHQYIIKFPQYRQLKQLIGLWADHSITALFNKYGGQKVVYDKKNKLNFDDGNKALLQDEMNKVLATHYHIGSLQQRARFGSLRGSLRDNPKKPSDYGAEESDTELWKAAKWITNSSTSLKNSGDNPNAPVNLAKIYAAMDHVIKNMDVRKLESLEYLHVHLVDQSTLKETRGPSKQVKYCSTGGAGYLQEKAADFARGIELPDLGNQKWDDLACYFIGAHMRAHGFTDGNGRAVRGIFACALIKGGRDFIVPESDFEKTLHCL